MLSIVLTILGLAAVIVFAIQVYKTAVSTERNAVGWTVLTVLTGLGFQFVIPFIVGVAIGIYLVVTGTPAIDLEYSLFGIITVINILSIVLSIVGMSMIMKIVSRIPDDVSSNAPPPPPPPTFDQNI